MPTMSFPIPVQNFLCDGVAGRATMTAELDSNSAKWSARFADAATYKMAASLSCPPVIIASGNVTCRIRWRQSGGGAGNVRFQVTPVDPGGNASWTAGGAVAATAAALGDNLLQETAVNLGAAVAQTVIKRGGLLVERLGADGADTFGGVVQILSVTLDFTVSSNLGKRWLWIPARGGMVVPAGSNAANVIIGTNYPALAFDKTDGLSFADAHFLLPTTYSGTIGFVPQITTNAAQNQVWEAQAAIIPPGGSQNPPLTAGDAFTFTNPYDSTVRTLPVTPNAGDGIILRLLRRGTHVSDSDTLVANLEGVTIEYSVGTKNPARAILTPASGIAPSSNPAQIIQINDSGSSKRVVRFPQAVDSTMDYWLGQVDPAVITAVAQRLPLRIRWRTSGATGKAKLDLYLLSRAVGADTTSAISYTYLQTVTTDGGNIENEDQLSFDVGRAPWFFTASESLILRVQRKGTDTTNDTLAADLDLLELIIETDLV